MRPIALGKSRQDILTKEIITPGSIIGFEKNHPGQVFSDDAGTESFLTSQLGWYFYLPQESILRCELLCLSI